MRTFLIWSIEHNGWWKPNGCGYTQDINYAGVYSEQEAVSICRGANIHMRRSGKPNEALVPVDNVSWIAPKKGPNG